MSDGIAYQNKDIEFKILSETYRERSFEAYGLKLPRIKAVLPTNLPEVSANELRMDNLFLLEDDTYALVDYESENTTENRIKYLNYIARVVKRIHADSGKVPQIRMIAIYTGEVKEAESVFGTGCVTLHMEQVFVSHLPAEEIYRRVRYKLENGEKLQEQELMQLVILPLAGTGKEEKQQWIRRIIRLAKQIKNEEEQKFVFSGLLVASDKFISDEDSELIRREITMTKVGKMIYEEGMEKGVRKGREEGKRDGRKEERIIAVFNMLKLHVPETQILELYSSDDLEAAKQLQ